MAKSCLTGNPGRYWCPVFPGADLVAVRRLDAFIPCRHLRLRRQADRVVAWVPYVGLRWQHIAGGWYMPGA